MNYCAFIHINTTQNDLWGSHNCPIQFCCEIFSLEEIHKPKSMLCEKKKFFNIIPDETVMPLGLVFSGWETGKPVENGEDLKTGLKKAYDIVSMILKSGMYVVGFNFLSYDMKILNENFKRVLNLDPLEFPKDKILDIFEMCENTVDVTEIGSYSTESMFEYYVGDREMFCTCRRNRSALTEITIRKLIFSEMIMEGETFSEMYDRTRQKDDLEIFNFGKYKGAKIGEVVKIDPSYISWIQNNKKFREESPNLISSINRILSKVQTENKNNS